MIPGGAWSRASRKSSSVTWRRNTGTSSLGGGRHRIGHETDRIGESLRRRFEPNDPASGHAGFAGERDGFHWTGRFMREMAGNRSRSMSRAALINRSFIAQGR
jgi:hypothetical protein